MAVRLSVIVPAYNEEDNVEGCYRELSGVLKEMGGTSEIIFVDDGSDDATFSRLLFLHDSDPSVRIVKLRRNFGQSAAMSAGFDTARGDLVVTMDADLQNDPHDIPGMIQLLESRGYDVVCGWRFSRHDPLHKRVASRLANGLRRRFTSETVHDSGCTLRVYRRECITDLDLYGELHRYIPAILQWKGYRIGEMKTNHRDRKYGSTKYNWRRLVKGGLDLLVVTFWQKYSTRPIHVFGGAGLLFGFTGMILAAYLVTGRLLYGMPLSERPLFLVAILFIIIGVQLFALGILADIMIKIFQSQGRKRPYLVERIVS